MSGKTQNDFRFTVDVDEQSMLSKIVLHPNKLYLSVASNWSYSKVIPCFWSGLLPAGSSQKHSAPDAYELEAEQLKRRWLPAYDRLYVAWPQSCPVYSPSNA